LICRQIEMDIFNRQILELFLSRTSKSRALWEAGRQILPDGGGGDMQCYWPYPIYMEHAQGSKLYDTDGHEYVDFFCGAGTVLLGHRAPVILEAVESALTGHSLSIAAGLALLKELENGAYYEHVQELASLAGHGLQKVFDDAGITCKVTGEVMGLWRGFWPHFSNKAPRNSRDFYSEYLLKLLNFYIGMIGHGIFMSPTGAPSVSMAHTREDIDKMLKAASSVLQMMKSG